MNMAGEKSSHISMLHKLVSLGLILCPKLHRPLKITDDGRFATAGGPLWKIQNGALDLYGNYSAGNDGHFEDTELTNAVFSALEFPDRPEIRAAVARAVADTAMVAADPAYSAEIAELADRLGLPRSGQMTMPSAPNISIESSDRNREVRISFESTFIESVLPPGRLLRRSVRIRNDGSSVISSKTNNPVNISYHWLDTEGNIVQWDGARSPLPVDLQPGGKVTVICDIETPAKAGHYRLQFQPVIEGMYWVEGNLLTREVTIDPDPPDRLPLAPSGRDYDYQEDHAVGLSMIVRYMNDKHADGPCRILEVGGGIHPQSAALMAHDCEVISIDISFAMSQLGQLYFDHVAWDKKRNISFISCDAHAPPFAVATFDGIIIFSALHHFAEPQRLLGNLRRVLKPDGFIAVMCEPCHPDRGDAMYLRDLSKGINEQCWSVEEYAEIFFLAGLKLASGQLDGGSLKVILVGR